MIAQIVVLIISGVLIIAYAKYEACNVVLIMLTLIKGISGLGDIQVGPELVIPDSGNILPKLNMEKLEPMNLLSLIVLSIGIALVFCCSLMLRGKRKHGISV